MRLRPVLAALCLLSGAALLGAAVSRGTTNDPALDARSASATARDGGSTVPTQRAPRGSAATVPLAPHLAPQPGEAPRLAATSTVGSPWEKGAAALALVDYPVARTGYTIVFDGPRSGLMGLTQSDTRVVTIFVRPTQSVAEVARVLAHELGHVVDLVFTTPGERDAYRSIRGLDGRRWHPRCNGCSDYASPGGDFAEVFAWWLVGPGIFRSTLAAPPSDSQLRQLASIFSAPAGKVGAANVST